MSYIIPNPIGRKLAQLNRNDFSGNLHVTKNIDLDEEGYIRLSSGVAAFYTQDDDEDFDNGDAMNIGDGTIFINGDEVFTGKVDGTSFSNISGETSAPSPTVEDDNVYFNETQVVSDGTTVSYRSGSAWTDISGLGISGSHPTVLETFDYQASLLVGHGNEVVRVNNSWVVEETLVLPNQYKVSTIACVGNVAYIGTRHDASGEAKMFLWDGNASTNNIFYGVESFELPTCRPYQSSVAGLTSDGRLIRFNGGGFDELGNLPVYVSPYDWSSEINDYSSISNRGMVVDGNLAYMVVSSEIQSRWKRHLKNFAGGVWCFDPEVGLYHRFSPSFSKLDKQLVGLAVGNTFNVTDAPITGTPVKYDGQSSGAGVGNLSQVRTYFTIRNSASSVSLAESEADAIAGNAITLDGVGDVGNNLLFFRTVDYGYSLTDNRSSIVILSESNRDDRYAERVAFTSNLRNSAGADRTALCAPVPNLPARGYFELPRLYARNQEDTFQRIDLKHSYLGKDDKIIVKYMVEESPNMPLEIDEDIEDNLSALYATWASTNSITTTRDISMLAVGDEVEFIWGTGAGFIAHITDITGDTITFDEDFLFAEAGAVCLFEADRWKKLGEINHDNQKRVRGFRIDKKGEFLKIRVELRGCRTTIYELQIGNQLYKPLKAGG